ncbi:MAG: hypothetical protein KC912_02420 [Proteobacteria bacterium]|nr:hypothetical protein [Pseudomonadota bacterium]
MRLITAAALLAMSGPALAGDVLFLDEPTAELRARVLAAESGLALTMDDLQPAGAGWAQADEDALSALAASLTDARTYETRLDGELVIMQQLALPAEKVTVLRNEEDRRALFAALAYQGFAVDRFFEEDIATDDRATDFRETIDARVVASPWANAVAIEPDQAVTPYEIADANGRARYEETRAHIRTALPALLVAELPRGVDLMVDGRLTKIDASGTVKLIPGRHLVHAEIDGRILERWTLNLGPTERGDVTLSVEPNALSGWVEGFTAAPGAPPPAIGKVIAKRGGILVVRGEQAWRVAGAGAPVAEDLPSARSTSTSEVPASGPSVDVALGGGWLGSPDFYFQDPTASEASFATVNAGSIGLGVGFAYDIQALRIVAGADVLLPLGASHSASYAGNSLRVRPTPLLGVGLRQAQIVGAYVLPHHLAFGGRLTLPLTAGLELRGTALAGLPPKRTRSDDSVWEGHVLGTAWLGVGWRFGG